MKKLLEISDAHIGYELKRQGDKLVKRRAYDTKALAATLEFARDFKPDIVLLGGDNHNMGFISRHQLGKPRLIEGLRAIDEYKLGDTELFQPLEALGAKEYIYLKGNHEYWVDVFLEQNPTVEGLIEPENYLNLAERGWEIINYGHLKKLGKLYFGHGENIRAQTKYVAAKAVESYGRNIVLGDKHTAQMFVSIAMADMDPHVGYVCPTMQRMDPDYTNNSPTRQVNGFIYGYIADNGNFNLYPVIITKGKFIVNGKEYGK